MWRKRERSEEKGKEQRKNGEKGYVGMGPWARLEQMLYLHHTHDYNTHTCTHSAHYKYRAVGSLASKIGSSLVIEHVREGIEVCGLPQLSIIIGVDVSILVHESI